MTLSLSLDAIKSLNRWDYEYISPGVVGSVGCVNMTERLKSTIPGDYRWSKWTHDGASKLGSNVQNGFSISYNSRGGPNRTIDSNWKGRRRFETSHGWRYQDLRPTDRTAVPTLGQLPQYTWRTKVANVQRAQRTAEEFPIPRDGLITPPRGVLRGGNFPQITAVVAEDPNPGDFAGAETRGPQQNASEAVTAAGGGSSSQEMGRINLRAPARGGAPVVGGPGRMRR